MKKIYADDELNHSFILEKCADLTQKFQDEYIAQHGEDASSLRLLLVYRYYLNEHLKLFE